MTTMAEEEEEEEEDRGGAIAIANARVSSWEAFWSLSARTRRVVVKAGLCGGLGGLLVGYDLGSVSGALPQLKEEFGWSGAELDGVVTAMLVGAVCGSALGSAVCDRAGRWRTIAAAGGVLFLAAGVLLGSRGLFQVYLGRWILGLGMALSIVADVPFLTEIAPQPLRGALVSLNELMIAVGMLLSFFVGWALRDVQGGWRWMFGISGLLALFQFAVLLRLPESPKWLVAKGREAEALAALCIIHGDEDLALADLIAARDTVKSCGEGSMTVPSPRETGSSLSTLLGAWNPQLRVALTLSVLQQLTSNGNVLAFGPEIYESLGLSKQDRSLSTLVLGVIKVLSTSVAVLKVDSLGRKRLLLTGALAIVGSLYTLSWSAFQYQKTAATSETPASWVAFGSSCALVASYSFSYGPITWLIVSELFPPNLRGRALGLAQVTNWLAQASLSAGFLGLIERWGTSATFALFGTASLVGTALIWAFVPETLGRDPEELRDNFFKKMLPISPFRYRSVGEGADIIPASLQAAETDEASLWIQMDR